MLACPPVSIDDVLPAATDLTDTPDLVALPVAAAPVVPVVNIPGAHFLRLTARATSARAARRHSGHKHVRPLSRHAR